VQTADGAFYGITGAGGANTCATYNLPGCGTVFKMTPAGKLTTLYSFCSQPNCTDGLSPTALLQATTGDLYGTTYQGGADGGGTVFEITASGELTTVYNFCAQSPCTDGSYPVGGLVQGGEGDFHGTTYAGGGSCPSQGIRGCGTIFTLTPAGALTTLHAFSGIEGSAPDGLVQAANGNFYGTTFTGTFDGSGGGSVCYLNAVYGYLGCGTIFTITPSATFTSLHSFSGGDGAFPSTGMIQAPSGDFYGTTYLGGTGSYGTVFEMTPSGAFTSLYSFCSQSGCTGPTEPDTGLVEDTNGVLYGTTEYGGASNDGAVFSLSVGLGPFVKTLPASGTVGQSVSILGTELKGASSVTFDGVAAVFEVVSNSLITTTVPTGASSGTVQVVTIEGTISSFPRFVVLP
jgi:uncharacterized repeat protein (TIGR03803 family)